MSYFIIEMPVNKEGKGPEMDDRKVVATYWEVWNEINECVSRQTSRAAAYDKMRELQDQEIDNE